MIRQTNDGERIWVACQFMKLYPFQVPPYLYSDNFFATRQHCSQTKTQTFPFFSCIRYITVNSLVQV
jgi:hypothetical protein